MRGCAMMRKFNDDRDPYDCINCSKPYRSHKFTHRPLPTIGTIASIEFVNGDAYASDIAAGCGPDKLSSFRCLAASEGQGYAAGTLPIEWEICLHCGEFGCRHIEGSAGTFPSCPDFPGMFFSSKQTGTPAISDAPSLGRDIRTGDPTPALARVITSAEALSGPRLAPALIAAGFLRPGQSVMERAAADAFGDEPLTTAEAMAINDAMFDGDAFEARMRGTFDQSDEEMMLEMIEDFLAVAMNHFEINADQMTDQTAQFAHLGISYAAYLADSIKQGKIVPTRTAKTNAITRRANEVMAMRRAQRPRIITLDKPN